MLDPRNFTSIPEEYGGGTVLDRRYFMEPVLDAEYSKAKIEIREPVITSKEPVMQTAMPTTTSYNTRISRTVRVLDDQGSPIPGAHVFFDQNHGNVTNFNGEATVSSSDPNAKVYVSYVGFETKGFRLQDLPATVRLVAGEMLNEVIIDAPAKAAKSDSKVPKYLFPAIGGVALLLILMSMGGPAPKKVTL